jgi:hypothetical protein
MDDIAMCQNTKCRSKKTCYRQQAKPGSYLQVYADFGNKPTKCEYYIKTRKDK